MTDREMKNVNILQAFGCSLHYFVVLLMADTGTVKISLTECEGSSILQCDSVINDRPCLNSRSPLCSETS
jgi:hypothetical protein